MIAHPCPQRIAPDATCRMLRPALAYASRGWPVFPCRPNKKPYTLHGFHDASTDRETLVCWWVTNPGALIGTPTGAASGLVCVDLDVDVVKGIDGMTAFAALVNSDGAPISTRKHRTPRGGIHLLFKHPGETLKNSTSVIAPGVDTRGDGGYIVLPPSKSEVGEYLVEADIESQPLPPWLCSLFRKHGIMTAPAVSETPASHTMPPGCPPSVATLVAAGAPERQRNDRALYVAVQLRDEGYDRATVERHVLTFAGNCQPPLPVREALAVVASAFTRPAREPARNPLHSHEHRKSTVRIVSKLQAEAPDPWEAPAPLGGLSEPPPQWPWNALPGALRDMGKAIERTFNVSPEMAGAAVLGVASIALGNKTKVELKRDHRQFANLFFMVGADVAAGKTPVTKAAQAPLVEWQCDQRESWKCACNEWDALRTVAEAQIRGLEDQAKHLAKGKGEADPEAIMREIARLRGEIAARPPEPILFCVDVTSEALGRRMQERCGAIGVLSGEARKILAIAKGRYVEGGDIDLWLAGHAGDYLRVDRSATDKPSYEIKEACLAAAIMTQPDSLQSLGAAEALRESGFLARWLYLVPDHNRGAYPVESVPEHVTEAYGQTIRALVDLPLAVFNDGTPAPHLVRLAPTAFSRWRAYHDATLAEISATRETKPGSYLQWLSKLPEHVARLALLFHAVRHVEGSLLGQIEPEIEDAIRLADALKVHARRAFALMGADMDTARARKVWIWLNRNRDKLRVMRERDQLPACEAVKSRDLDRAEVAGVKNSAEAEVVLMLLADKGYVQAVDFRPPVGKAHRLFYLHPADQQIRATEYALPDIPDKPDTREDMSGKSGLSGISRAEIDHFDTDKINAELDLAAAEDADKIEEVEL